MDMILLDWTRMGKAFCVAGVVAQEGQYRVVRPLPARAPHTARRKIGWSAFQLGLYARWDVFELIAPRPAPADPPHLEDIWVRDLRPQRRSASTEQRRAILTATVTPADEPLFGAPLAQTSTAGYLEPGRGKRSLASLVVRSGQIAFGGSRRAGTAELDLRVKLPIPELGERVLPCKDHHLLAHVERRCASLNGRLAQVHRIVRNMGEQVVVRLGLSRPYPQDQGREPARCWLMADGFFSLLDPQA